MDYRLPEGSCDCHFPYLRPVRSLSAGTRGRFTAARPFTIEDAFGIWNKLGITRGVIVHAVGSGEDNAVTYDALRRYPDRLRAVAILQADVSDRRLDELTDAGFRPVRVTMIRQDGKPVSTLGTSYDDLVKLAPRIAERGWHAQLWIESSDLAAAAADLEKLPLNFVIDHMSRTMADKGHEHPDFRTYTERLKTGRYWTKISGADRNTRIGRPYADTAPFMRAIVQAAPDQVVWGSDWPHVGHTAETMPDLQDLLRLLHECVPDEATRRKILIDNPARLYNFLTTPEDTLDTNKQLPLDGVIVIDLGQVYQGPYAGFLMAQAGATVIKVEPPNGEPVRHRARISKGNAVPFAMLNANKRNISLNLKSPDGIKVLKELAAKADVLIENYAPGVLDRLGVGCYSVLSAINPRLIYGSATGYGLSGPDRDNLAMDLTVQAVSGIMSVTGFADGPPVKAGPAITDFISGVHLYAGIVTALYDREKSGRGRLVEIAMVETVYPAMASNLADVFNRKAAAPRTGNRHGGLAEAPYNVYPAADGHVAIISVNESHWSGLTRAMGRPELAEDPRFKTVLDRLKHIDLTDQVVSEWSSRLPRNGITELCRANRVPCAAVRDLREVTEDTHLRARGMLREIEHPEYGDILVHRSPLVLHDAATPDYIPSARLGQHNGEVLSEYLGLSEREIEALRHSGAIAQA